LSRSLAEGAILPNSYYRKAKRPPRLGRLIESLAAGLTWRPLVAVVP